MFSVQLTKLCLQLQLLYLTVSKCNHLAKLSHLLLSMNLHAHERDSLGAFFLLLDRQLRAI